MPWWQRPFTLTLAGGMLFFMALPPFAWWPLAFLAPIPWIAVALQSELPGRRPWLKMWLAAWCSWLVLLYYIRVPHWLLNFGWVVMSAYLCCYVPLFIAVTRRAVLRWGWSPLIVAPLAWVGTEYLRSTLFGGFAMSLLGHSLVRFPIAIQVADIAGGYWVSGLIVLVATSIYLVSRACLQSPATSASGHRGDEGSNRRSVSNSRVKRAVMPGVVAIGAVAATLGYGAWRLSEPVSEPGKEPARIALIQGTIDTTFPDTEQEANEIRERTFSQYEALTRRALQDHQPLDLIVWPEGKFTAGPDLIAADGWSGLPESQRSNARAHQADVAWAAQVALGTQSTPSSGNRSDEAQRKPGLLVGCSTWDLSRQQSFNSALRFDSDGEIRDRYFKMHRVMFGEYIPLAEFIPAIYEWTPIGTGLTPGDTPVTIVVRGYKLSPSICFESTVPHLMRRHVRELSAADERPDALINLSDDGWFYGTAALDHHLACNVFRAVELRLPMLVAANTGLSAVVDSNGRIKSKGPRREEDVLIAELQPVRRSSLYESIGDWPAQVALLFCATVLILGIRLGRRENE